MSKTERLFHPRTLVIHPDFKNLEEFIVSIPERFQRNEGTVIHQGRNECILINRQCLVRIDGNTNILKRTLVGICLTCHK